MVEVPIKDDCGSYKFNINKFETKDGRFLAVTGAECWRPDVNVSFDDTVETLYEKLTDDNKDADALPVRVRVTLVSLVASRFDAPVRE